MRKYLLLLSSFCYMSFCVSEIYDCFPFFNELKLLEVRLEELYDVIDHFVIVEGVKTFSGNEKPLYYQENKHLFEKYQDKIIHVIVDHYPFPDGNNIETNWLRDEYQRNAILQGLINCKSDDIVLISDADEIPNLQAITEIKQYFLTHNFKNVNFNQNKLVVELHMRLMLLYLNLEDIRGWAGAVKAAPYWIVKKVLPQNIRLLHSYDRNLPKIFNAGWHFHAMGGKEKVAYKLKSMSTAYQEMSYDDFFTWVKEVYNPIIVPINHDFPKYILNNLDYFYTNEWIITTNI